MIKLDQNIDLVKKFIEQEILAPGCELNSCDLSGDHTGFIVSAAKKSGLVAKRIGHGYYFFEGDRCVGGLRDMKTSLVSSVAVAVASRKNITKELFAESGVQTPRGESFLLSQFDEAVQFFRHHKDPVVVKPASAAAGDGVSLGISSEGEFTEAWKIAKSAMSSSGRILVEELVAGIDLRVFVVDGVAVAATTRVPPFVVGDGTTSIAHLIEDSNRKRKQHKYLGRMPIVPNASTLVTQGFSMSSTPDQGEIVVINMTINMHQGGTNMDVTDQLCPELKALAVRATTAIPGLAVGGLDLMVKSLQSAKDATVLEANTAANVSVHHLPGYGSPVDVSQAIIAALRKTAGSY